MTPRLYVDPAPGELRAGASLVLPRAAAHHALRVLRLREGAAVTLFDGRGGEWPARLAATDKRGTTASIDVHDPVERESSLAVTLAISMLATDAMDYAVRKAVELGVAAISPVVAARSQGASRGERRVEHWRQIAIAACEQCGRNRIPSVGVPLPLAAWLDLREPQKSGIVLSPGGTTIATPLLAPSAVDVLVGPEGGFDAAELGAATRAGMIAVALGPRVLKAETACVAMLAVLQHTWGDLR